MDKKTVIAYFGGLSATAHALGISRQAVFKWPEQVPQLRSYHIQAVTKGKLKVSDRKPAPGPVAHV